MLSRRSRNWMLLRNCSWTPHEIPAELFRRVFAFSALRQLSSILELAEVQSAISVGPPCRARLYPHLFRGSLVSRELSGANVVPALKQRGG